MSYAQTNYLQPIGIPPTRYTIAETGCFLTSFANLLTERFGKPIDPVSLNAIFRDRNIYIDVDDGVRDDLGWSSITAYDGSVTVVATGPGYPSSDNSIVRFNYNSKRTGQPTTHFCLDASAANKTIIDSWDGKVKPMSAYGVPSAYASYANVTPQAVTPITTPSPAVNVGRQLFLPAAAGTWRIYNLGGPYGVGHEIYKLAPGNFPPGLTYDILDTLAPNIFKIHTESKGDVAIYAGPDTIAQFRDAPAPQAPVAATAPAPAPIEVPAVTVTTNPNSTVVFATNPPTTDPVHVEVAEPAPSVPEAVPVTPVDWKKTDDIIAGDYYSEQDAEIKDIEGLQMPIQLHKGDLVHVAEGFTRDGINYARTVKSVKNDYWYGVPVVLLKKSGSDKDLNDVLDEIFGKPDNTPIIPAPSKQTVRNVMISGIGYLAGLADRLFHSKNKNKEIGR